MKPSKPELVPHWRVRIASAVSRHGRLKEVADAAGMTSPQLQKLANGTNKNPGVQTLERVGSALGLSLAEMISEPRPEGDPGHVGPRERNPLLTERWRPIVEALDAEMQAEDTWRGDTLKAIAVLTRALSR